MIRRFGALPLGLLSALAMVGVLALSPLSASAAAPSASPWPQPRGNASRQGLATAPGPVAPKLVWETDLPAPVTVSPVTGLNGCLHVASGSTILTYDASGTEVWRYDAGGEVVGLASGPKGDLYAVLHRGRIFSLSPAGQARWSSKMVAVGPLTVLSDGTVVAGGVDGVHGYSADGVKKFRFEAKPICGT